jgi:hypothetical protein
MIEPCILMLTTCFFAVTVTVIYHIFEIHSSIIGINTKLTAVLSSETTTSDEIEEVSDSSKASDASDEPAKYYSMLERISSDQQIILILLRSILAKQDNRLNDVVDALSVQNDAVLDVIEAPLLIEDPVLTEEVSAERAAEYAALTEYLATRNDIVVHY